MKAITCTEYGPPEVLKLEEIPRPEPRPDEILVRVRATTVNYGDLTARNFGHLTARQFNMPALLYFPARLSFGWKKPKVRILGSELAGCVESTGSRVRKFQPGDAVFAYLGTKMGAYAEYVCLPENGTITHKPANLSYAEAAAIPYGAVMATGLLSRSRLGPGKKALIIGASGSIGSMAVQLAKYYGAEVTGVCSADGLDYVRALGADRALDYRREEFARDRMIYDLIFDVLGKSSFSRLKPRLAPDGLYLLASFKLKAIWQMMRTAATGRRKRVVCAFARESAENLALVGELAEAGRVRAIIDRTFPLEQAAEAHRYAEAGGRKGAIVITVDGDGK
ncbi:MAG: NAD(P)-dependent alcohol dehydrogenase [Candidatus Aminicenantes bacterium]|nr:NAD(P)-dependent alcohol dehydrogenase [Candidatus Aminicenantes bacterium]